MALHPNLLGVPAVLPTLVTGVGFFLELVVVLLRAAGRFPAWLICCHLGMLYWFIFQLTKVPLKLKSSVFTNIYCVIY